MGRVLRRIATGSLLVVVLFAAITAAMVSRGERAMRASDKAFDAGHLRDAIAFAKRAAVAYVPGAPHVEQAYARLESVAVGSEASGHPDIARQAWEASRGALLQSEHLWQPHPARLARANRNLARLLSADSEGERRGREATEALVSSDVTPAPIQMGLLVLGFVLAISGLGLLIWRGIDPGGGLIVRNARLAALLTLLGVACWTIAVYKA